jgi:Cysteine-rich CPCC
MKLETPIDLESGHTQGVFTHTGAAQRSDARPILYRMKWPCVCCGCFTLPGPTGTTDEICPICFWQDDAVDNEGTEVLGPNKVTLAAARANYRSFGAAEVRVRGFVRKPQPDELSPNLLSA